MTKISSQSITCPKCQHEGEFRMYETVNVTLDKSLRERVFSDDLFKWTCPECGESFTIVYPFLYHDMDNGFMIHFSPSDCESINEQYNELLTKFPGMRKGALIAPPTRWSGSKKKSSFLKPVSMTLPLNLQRSLSR